MMREIKNKTNRFGKSMRYVPAWSWPKMTEEFIKATVTEHPILHAGAGSSLFGDIRIDKFKTCLLYTSPSPRDRS